MAEVLAQRCFLSSCSGHASSSLSCAQRKSPAFVALRRGSFPGIEPLRSSFGSSGFRGRRLVAGAPRGKLLRGCLSSVPVQVRGGFELPVFSRFCPILITLSIGCSQMTLSTGKSLKWWEKGLQANMKEIESAQDLVDSLLNAGDKLVVVDFFSSGCGGCRALHPKIKKFKDALAKHSTDRCSLGPAKGLEESELLALAANKDLSFNYAKKPSLFPSSDDVAERARAGLNFPVPATLSDTQDSEDKAMATAGR
ncbi:hypothetical protein B296_00002775 [Ensete ventricosum]|uniref:Thioredoxin domain-containing protein n=1 Tax=Ensete ventricosum TaxID=4639 RepID=A0A427A8N7_ENSVE|nr:hypothetical protein B296_00002775 [Ensete ventricosum]